MKRLEETAIWQDVKRVFKNASEDVRYEMKATIHTEKEDIPTMKVVSVDVVRDYTHNIGDDVTIAVVVPLGDYIKRIYPNRNNLELSLHRQSLNELAETIRRNRPRNTERLKAVFLTDENPNVRTTEYDNIDKFSLDTADIVTVKFQLLNRSLEVLRVTTTYGAFHNETNEDIIRTIMIEDSKKILVDGKPAIQGFDIRKPDNMEIQPQVIIPQGTHLTAIPTYLQERMGGVYTAGIGNYLQNYDGRNTWFVYPLFNVKRAKESKGKSLVIYSIPKDRYTSVERTFMVEGNRVHLVATSDKQYNDSAENNYAEFGVGFRMTEARSMMYKPVEMTPEGPVGTRSQLNHEVGLIDRSDNINYAPIADRDISANPFAQYSRIASRAEGNLNVNWQNADHRVIYPNMPVTYMYMENDKLKKADGVLLFAHCYMQLDGKGMGINSHTTTINMVLYLKNQ